MATDIGRIRDSDVTVCKLKLLTIFLPMGRDDSRGDVGIAWSPAWRDGAVALILHRDNHRKWDDAKENSIQGWVFIFPHWS